MDGELRDTGKLYIEDGTSCNSFEMLDILTVGNVVSIQTLQSSVFFDGLHMSNLFQGVFLT